MNLVPPRFSVIDARCNKIPPYVKPLDFSPFIVFVNKWLIPPCVGHGQVRWKTPAEGCICSAPAFTPPPAHLVAKSEALAT
jgi:hypothetical protein